MPIYEYACQACEHEFELLQPMRAPPPQACPACGAGQVRKRVSATSFVLKGSGWYRDHYGLKRTPSKCVSNSDSKGGSPKASTASSAPAPTAARPAADKPAAKAAK